MSGAGRGGFAVAAAVLSGALGCGGGTAPSSGGATAPAAAPPEETAASGDGAAIRAIELAINENAAAAHRCWRRAAAADYQLAGGIALAITLGEGGATADVAIAADDVKAPALSSCLIELWRGVRWPPVFAAGDAIQVPLVFVAPDFQYVVATADVPITPAGEGVTAQVVLDAQATGNPAASLSLLHLAAGARVAPHARSSTEVAFVLGGDGRLVDLGGGRPRALAAGDAAYVAGGVVHGLEAGRGGLELLVVHAPAGAEAGWEGGRPAAVVPLTPSELRPRRGAPVPRLARVASTSALPRPGVGEARILFDAASAGDGTIALSTLTADAGAAIPSHTHDGSTEVVYLLEGAATMTIGGDELAIVAGDAVQIPPGTPHEVKVADGAPLKLIQVYTPAGPEQRFRVAAPPRPTPTPTPVAP